MSGGMQATHQVQPYDVIGSAQAGAGLSPRDPSAAMRESSSRHVNVNRVERAVSLLAGGYLLARSRKRSGKLLALLGSSLIYRGFSGHCHLYQALGFTTAAREL